MRQLFLIGVLSLFCQSCKSQDMLPTVENLDLSKYQGKWYEIARLPNSFEKGLTSVSATYSIKENGKINVLNAGFKSGDKQKDINGTAWVPNKDYPGRLKVRFFWPFSGNYYVIAIDNDYQYALVGSPSRKFLWLLSKNVDMPEEVYNEYTKLAQDRGFAIDELIQVDQSLNRIKNN